jgi:hypothetical protein
MRRFLGVLALSAGAILLMLVERIVAQPVTDQPWEALTPVPESDGLAGACASIIGNKIYVAFGHTGNSGTANDTNRLRIYDIATDLWSFGPSAPSTSGRADHYLGVAKGGKLFCLGGRPSNDTWSFDPATMTWAQKAPFPDGFRVGTASATYGNSIFVFGGRSGDVPCQSQATTRIRRYDVDLNSWFDAGQMTLPRSDATVARVGGKIYLFGGCNSPVVGTAQFYDSVEIYDPRTATSTLLLGATLPGGPRANLAAGDPQNGSSANASHRIHITGGWSSTGMPPPEQNHAIFDVDQLGFLTGTAMPNHCPHDQNRAEHELLNGKDRIFAVGGACPTEGTAQSNVDMQKLSADPPVQSASITASSCNVSTYPVCLPDPLGISVFVTGSGFAPLSTVQLTSSLQGVLLPAVTDVQGEFTSIYVDVACNGQSRTITATDADGNVATIAFNCP